MPNTYTESSPLLQLFWSFSTSGWLNNCTITRQHPFYQTVSKLAVLMSTGPLLFTSIQCFHRSSANMQFPKHHLSTLCCTAPATSKTHVLPTDLHLMCFWGQRLTDSHVPWPKIDAPSEAAPPSPSLRLPRSPDSRRRVFFSPVSQWPSEASPTWTGRAVAGGHHRPPEKRMGWQTGTMESTGHGILVGN